MSSSAPTTPSVPTAPSAALRHDAPSGTAASLRLTLARVIRSEWIKLRTLRGTWVFLAAVVLLLVALSAVAAAVSTGSVESPDGGGPPGFDTSDPLTTVLTGSTFAVLLLGVFGALAGAREFGSRMIVASVAAVPRRWQVLTGKAVVVTALTVPAALVGTFAAFFVGMAVLGAGDGATVAIGDDGVVAELFGMTGYLTAIALLGLGLGVLLRSVASSISTLVAGVLVLPGLAAALLPASWDTILQVLPTNAAAAFTAVTSGTDDLLSSGAGVAVLAAWVVVALGAAAVSFQRRDV
jgi:ABC-type transport system involved in multi-copper enzyme maturation permease subunit